MTTRKLCLAAVGLVAPVLGCQSPESAGPDPLPIDPDPIEAIVRTPVAISAGGGHACALMSDGTVFCWGDNNERQIGDGGVQDAKAPKRVRHIADAAEVAAGWAHTCVRKMDGTVDCWGSDLHGQLGVGKDVWGPHWTPQTVVNLYDVVHIAVAGDTTCAVRVDGAASCWGAGAYGTLGNGTEGPSAEPVLVSLSEAVSIAAWGSSACARTPDRTVHCWGVSIGTPPGSTGIAYSTVPVHVEDLEPADHIAIGNAHICVLWPEGAAACFGENDRGQLGDGTTDFRSQPVPVEGLHKLEGLSLGNRQSCGWDADGQVWCWGWDGWHALGTPEEQDEHLPILVSGVSGVVQVVAGFSFVCALRDDGAVYCWGSYAIGDGRGLDAATPTRVAFNCEGQDGDGICPLVRCQREKSGLSYEDCYRTVFSSDDGCRCATEDDCQKLEEEEWVPQFCDEPPYSNGT